MVKYCQQKHLEENYNDFFSTIRLNIRPAINREIKEEAAQN